MRLEFWEDKSNSLKLSNILRTAIQPMVRFRQFANIKDVYGDGLGSLEIKEKGLKIPYTNSSFAGRDIITLVTNVLARDACKQLDAAAYRQFNATSLFVTPTSGNSASSITLNTGGATNINRSSMSEAHVRKIVSIMRELKIKPNYCGDYYCIGRPETFKAINLEHPDYYSDSRLFSGEIGRYNGCRFVEQTNIASKGWAGGLSDEAFFFGEDTIAEVIAVPEEIILIPPGDYNCYGIGWNYLGGFVISSINKIIKWSSNEEQTFKYTPRIII
jgi:hypothetical protein